jgi:hypothetical protein
VSKFFVAAIKHVEAIDKNSKLKIAFRTRHKIVERLKKLRLCSWPKVEVKREPAMPTIGKGFWDLLWRWRKA